MPPSCRHNQICLYHFRPCLVNQTLLAWTLSAVRAAGDVVFIWGASRQLNRGASLPKGQGREGYWEQLVPATPFYISTTMSTHLVLASGPRTCGRPQGRGWRKAGQADMSPDLPRWLGWAAHAGANAGNLRPPGNTRLVTQNGPQRRSPGSALLSQPGFLCWRGQSPGQLRACQEVSDGPCRAGWSAARPKCRSTGRAARLSKDRVPVHSENGKSLFGVSMSQVPVII